MIRTVKLNIGLIAATIVGVVCGGIAYWLWRGEWNPLAFIVGGIVALVAGLRVFQVIK